MPASRFFWLIFTTAFLASAQEKISTTRVFTEPAGAQFYVDGQLQTGPATFLWPAGSKHVLAIDPLQYVNPLKTRFKFVGWTDSSNLLNIASPTVVVTADAGITYIKANLTLEHAVSLIFYACPGTDATLCNSPGTIYVNGTPYTLNADIYLSAGGTVTLQAFPNPGYVFTGWQQGLGNTVQAFVNSFVLRGPTSVYPHFESAGKVTLLSDPPQLNVLADRATVRTPTTLEWGVNTTHTLGVVTPQVDLQGRLWAFDSWSDGGAETHAFKMAEGGPQTVTARFINGARLSFLTDPPGLKLKVDGRDNWQSYNFTWGVGTAHTVSAPPQQTDAKGRTYVFRSWSNAGAATQEVTVTPEAAASGFRLTANYEILSKIVIQSSPPGVPLSVDGAECKAPCTVERPVGSKLNLNAPESVSAGDGTRLDFMQWSEAPGAAYVLTTASEAQSVTASYRLRHQLRAVADPPDGATWRVDPASADGYYDAQSQVSLTLELRPGFRFRNWEGDLSGPFRSGVLTMTGPKTVRAWLDRVPFITPSGVRNAAGDTADGSVAPGSLVAIFGANLAPLLEAGPENPLAQTLAGVTVRLGNRLLPLLFVSPGQINLQLPWDIEEGPQILTVRSEGQPEVTGSFAVARNAPGLFGPVAHEDGTLVSPESPARRGETVTIFGTGFGPYDRRPPEGFAVPRDVPYKLMDAIEIVADGASLPASASAVAGRTGVAAARFKIAPGLPSATTIDINVNVNGHASNSVQLPLE